MFGLTKRGKTSSTVAVSVFCLVATVGTGAAFAATGQLDTTFNTTGKVLLPSPGNDTAWDVATQPDGKIVAVGSTTDSSRAMVWRYNTDGTPDLGFNAADTPGSIALDFGGDDLATSVAVAPTGKILVAGITSLNSDGFLAVLKADGTTDNGFSTDGMLPINSGGFDQIFGVAGTADGHVLAAGSAAGNAAVYRFDSTGAPDMSCDIDGVASVDAGGGSDVANDMALQSNGDIVIAGNGTTGNGFVARLLASNCSLDSGNFHSPTGIAPLDSGGSEQVLGVTIQPDGKIIASGFTSVNNDGALYRLNANGTPDNGFDTDGAFGIDSGGNEQLFDAKVQADGKIVTAGSTTVGGDAAVYRVLSTGGLDPSFDGDGAIGIDASGTDQALGLALEPDGRAVAAGQASGPPPTGFIFRLQTDPLTTTPVPNPTTGTPGVKKKKKCKKHKKKHRSAESAKKKCKKKKKHH
jgi:uncharacterized delta-60 repeat protein